MSGDRFDVLERLTPLFESPDLSIERFLRRRDRKRRQRRVAAGIVGSAVSVAVVVVAMLSVGGTETQREPNATIAVSENSAASTTTTTVAARGSSAVDVATGFVRAQAAFDADAVIGYLADDFVGGADLGDFGRTPQEIRQVLALFEAQRSRQMLQPCVAVEDSAEGVVVRCPFDAHGFGSEELGFGPYTGQSWVVTVREGRIVRARTEWNNIEHMIQEVIEPFGQWVQANHPDDVAVMYIDGNPTDFQPGEASSRLWEQRLDEYVAEQTAKVDVAEALMAAWTDGDGAAVAGLFAADGTWEGFAADTLPALHDWYRAVGGVYQSGGCELRPVVQQIGCSYTWENDLTRFLGADPETESFALDIADGEITTVRDTYDSHEDEAWQLFHTWIADNHGDDVERMYTADSRFARWDATSIDLWARYLDDFVASTEGYIARSESICTAAHARFNDELAAAGIEMELSPEDDGSGLQLVPSNDDDRQAFEDAARRVEREALLELFAVQAPQAVFQEFDVGVRLLEQFAEGEGETDPEDLWSQVRDLGLGLEHCTFSLRN
jgi:hypothetical protein